jgi:hypothetical protein
VRKHSRVGLEQDVDGDDVWRRDGVDPSLDLLIMVSERLLRKWPKASTMYPVQSVNHHSGRTNRLRRFQMQRVKSRAQAVMLREGTLKFAAPRQATPGWVWRPGGRGGTRLFLAYHRSLFY